MSPFSGTAPARQQAAIRATAGALMATKFVLVAVDLSLASVVASGVDGEVLTVTLAVLVGLGASLALAVGRRGREAAVVAVAMAALLMVRVPSVASHHFTLLTWLVALVACCDRAALDGWPTRSTRVSRWPLGLLRCQLTIVYLFTAASKANTDFLSGLVAYRLVRTSLVPIPLPGGLARSAPFLGATAALLIGVEVFLALAVWSRRLRPAAFAVTLPLHVGMTFLASADAMTLVEIALFTVAVFALYFAFVDLPADLVVLHVPTGGHDAARRLARLDLLGIVDQAPTAGAGWLLEGADGHRIEGRAAVQAVLGWSPVGFLLGPWLGVAPLRGWADRRFGTAAALPTEPLLATAGRQSA